MLALPIAEAGHPRPAFHALSIPERASLADRQKVRLRAGGQFCPCRAGVDLRVRSSSSPHPPPSSVQEVRKIDMLPHHRGAVELPSSIRKIYGMDVPGHAWTTRGRFGRCFRECTVHGCPSVCQKTNVGALSRRKQGFDSPRARQTGSGPRRRTVPSRSQAPRSIRPGSHRSSRHRRAALALACPLRAARGLGRHRPGALRPADARVQAIPASGFGTWSAQKAGVAATWNASASAPSRASAKPARATLKAAKRSFRCWALAGVVRL